jgi:diadenosine tetraphosphate (Ap4A) HIT family hydrolase
MVLLMNDSQFPWYILVPEVNGITEIFQLNRQQQHLLIEESSQLAMSLNEFYNPDKLNIAAIGNLVPQLHIHHVVRFQHDKAWPFPIWGKYSTVPYAESELITLVEDLAECLKLNSNI